jgi:Protein of unknown function (DUF3489)
MPKSSNKAHIWTVKNAHKSSAASRNATKPTRTATKSSLILNILGRASGATVKELAVGTNWQDHSVHGYLSGTLKKKMGLLVTSEIIDGTRHYRAVRQSTAQ